MSVPVVRFTVAGQHTHEPDAPTIGEPGRRYTVIYDGYCRICGRMVKLLAKWDRNHELEIIPSQTEGVHARFPWIPQRAYTESVQVIRNSDGKTWQAAAAIEELLKAMPKGRLFSWLFKIPFVRPVGAIGLLLGGLVLALLSRHQSIGLQVKLTNWVGAWLFLPPAILIGAWIWSRRTTPSK